MRSCPHLFYFFFIHACKTLVCVPFTGSEWPRAQNNGPSMSSVWHRYSVKCSKHGLRAFIGAVQRRIAKQTVTMLTSCWQVLSEVELRRIFDVCKRWPNSNFACICKKNMLRCMRPHGRFAYWSCKKSAFTLNLGLAASAAGSYFFTGFTLVVREPHCKCRKYENTSTVCLTCL